jgi:CRISPR-associated endonuclease Csn1
MEHAHLNFSYALGLDIGMASVGAAVLADDHIRALHVRTFNAAETAKEGESLNLIRREARLARRRIRRRAFRLTRLRRLFKRVGLIDDYEAQAFTTAASPWELRAEGLNRTLKPTEWAAALYHLVKHRGFQSNRKSEVLEDEKAGKMLSVIETEINEPGFLRYVNAK